jgi:signal recognition particle subunit SRP19
VRISKKIRIWPIYFDAGHSRSEGRKVSKKLAVRTPKVEEIKMAAEELGLNPSVEYDLSHPKYPWIKTGVVLVDSADLKTRLLRMISKRIQENR